VPLQTVPGFSFPARAEIFLGTRFDYKFNARELLSAVRKYFVEHFLHRRWRRLA
jgi:hypothetical protein